MPLNKNFLFELSVFIAVVAITGHLTTHFWDKYFFHNEISNMKTSLHLLKHTVMDIGAAYDSLHKELKEMAKIEQRKSCAIHHHHHEQHHRHLDRRKEHDMNVLSMLKERNNPKNDAKSKTNQSTQNDLYNSKNATTLTRSSLKSTGVGVETRQYCVYKKDCHCNKTHRNLHWKY